MRSEQLAKSQRFGTSLHLSLPPSQWPYHYFLMPQCTHQRLYKEVMLVAALNISLLLPMKPSQECNMFFFPLWKFYNLASLRRKHDSFCNTWEQWAGGQPTNIMSMEMCTRWSANLRVVGRPHTHTHTHTHTEQMTKQMDKKVTLVEFWVKGIQVFLFYFKSFCSIFEIIYNQNINNTANVLQSVPQTEIQACDGWQAPQTHLGRAVSASGFAIWIQWRSSRLGCSLLCLAFGDFLLSRMFVLINLQVAEGDKVQLCANNRVWLWSCSLQKIIKKMWGIAFHLKKG